MTAAKQAAVEHLGAKAAVLDALQIAAYFHPSYWPAQDGGRYYHYDANCPSVSHKFLPLTPFDSGMLYMRPQYSVLTNCPVCVK